MIDMTLHEMVVLLLAGGAGLLISVGFWLMIAKDEFIDSCHRYVTENDDPDFSTFPPGTIHSSEE